MNRGDQALLKIHAVFNATTVAEVLTHTSEMFRRNVVQNRRDESLQDLLRELYPDDSSVDLGIVVAIAADSAWCVSKRQRSTMSMARAMPF